MRNGQGSSLIRVNRIKRARISLDEKENCRKLKKNARKGPVGGGVGWKDTRWVFLPATRVTFLFLFFDLLSPFLRDHRLIPPTPARGMSPLMKFLYYFNKRYSPLSDRGLVTDSLCRAARLPPPTTVARDSLLRPCLCASSVETFWLAVSSRRILHAINFANHRAPAVRLARNIVPYQRLFIGGSIDVLSPPSEMNVALLCAPRTSVLARSTRLLWCFASVVAWQFCTQGFLCFHSGGTVS